jgi:hypothetical protein
VVESVQKSDRMDLEEDSEGESKEQQQKKPKIENSKISSYSNNSHDDNMSVGSAGSDSKMDELRKKLQDRIIQLKQQRQSKKPDTNNKKKEKEKQKDKAKIQQKKTDNNNKSKQQQKKGGGNDDDNHSLANSIDSSLDQLRSDLVIDGSSWRSSNNGVEADFEFNQITQMKKNDEKGNQKQGFHVAPGGTKKQRLQRLLDEAEKKRQRYQQLSKSTNPLEKQKLQSEQWNDVLSSAAGKKTILVASSSSSDPSASSSSTGNGGQMVSKSEIKIKKALKRLEKKKEKSTIEWNDRITTVSEEKNKRQNKREENLAKRRKGGLEATLIDGEKAKEIQGGSNRNHSGSNKVKINRPGQPQQQHSQQHPNKHQSNDHNKKPNRAGFEGKKSDGKFLNQK